MNCCDSQLQSDGQSSSDQESSVNQWKVQFNDLFLNCTFFMDFCYVFSILFGLMLRMAEVLWLFTTSSGIRWLSSKIWKHWWLGSVILRSWQPIKNHHPQSSR